MEGSTGNDPITPRLPDSNSIGRARTDSDKSRTDSSTFGTRSWTDSVNRKLSVDSSSISFETRATGGGSLLLTLPLLPGVFDILQRRHHDCHQHQELR